MKKLICKILTRLSPPPKSLTAYQMLIVSATTKGAGR